MKIAIIGYGKMGHEIEKVLLARGHSVVLCIDKENTAQMTDENLQKADVAIEFSAPNVAYHNILRCIEAHVPVVCGTTAWLDKYDEVTKRCNALNGAFFYASNYSVGVNLFFAVSRHLADMMSQFSNYDVTLSEVHHTAKKDAPSGTAITLAEGILESAGRKKQWHLGTTTQPEQLEVTSMRRSVAAGTHTVVWESESDIIEIEHMAKDRSGFAVGAVMAAEFLVGRHGVFTMKDMLGL
ncbi:MAG: 4-hydroxy-tetrahydrodipicolinate reductase [Mucinivorans sp.]